NSLQTLHNDLRRALDMVRRIRPGFYYRTLYLTSQVNFDGYYRISTIGQFRREELGMDTKPSSTKHKNILVSWEDKKPLVARIWRGRTRRDKADDYAEILQASTHLIASKPNNLGVQMFRNDKDDVSEFMVMSYW